MQERGDNLIDDGWQSGCADAWQTFYDSHCQRIWQLVARWLGGSSTDIADIVQETFLSAARSAQQFDPNQGTPMNWLAGIARNQIALHFRKRKNVPQTLDARPEIDSENHNLFDNQASRDPAPDEQLKLCEQRQWIRIALLELSDDQALLLSARYLEERPIESLATEYRCTSNAVLSRLVRARKAFRSALTRVAGDHFGQTIRQSDE